MRCLVSGKPGVGAASMARLKLGCPTNVAGRPRRANHSASKGNKHAKASVWRRSLAKRPSHRRAQIFGATQCTVLAPRARKVGVIRNWAAGESTGMWTTGSSLGRCFWRCSTKAGNSCKRLAASSPITPADAVSATNSAPACWVKGPAAARRRHSGWRRRSSATTGAAWRSPEGSNAVMRTVVTLPRYQGSEIVGFADRVFDPD